MPVFELGMKQQKIYIFVLKYFKLFHSKTLFVFYEMFRTTQMKCLTILIMQTIYSKSIEQNSIKVSKMDVN